MAFPQVECQECKKMIAGPQLRNHMKSMHSHLSSVGAPPDDDDMQWEDPPEQRRRGRLEDALRVQVAGLKRHPKRWARVRNYGGPTSAGATVGKARRAFPDCEFRAARIDGGSALWGRYIGG